MKFCCATADVWISAVVDFSSKRIFIPGAFIPTVLYYRECVKYFYF